MTPRPPALTLVGALEAVPPRVARHLRVVPLRIEGDTLVAGIDEASDELDALEALERRAGDRRIALERVPRALVEELLGSWYGPTGDLFELASALSAAGAPADDKPSDEEKTAAVRYTELLLAAALGEDATDIHVEPHPTRPTVRFRLHGVLVERPAPPPGLVGRVIARIKALAGLELGECLYAQDGQLRTEGPRGLVDVRVSILPTDRGECAVLRLLAPEGQVPGLAPLGLDDRDRRALTEAAMMPDGLIVLAGPTGSGKTTTLHSVLAAVDCRTRNVVSIEEPVEIRSRAIRQVPVRRNSGLDFAGALRVVLRQDPDVILVGETRDPETARLAIQASLAGHLVLTTVHASSTVGVFDRFDQLGGERRLVAETVRLVVSQRLIRKVCAGCGGAGCFRCEGSGLLGRRGIYEVLVPDDRLRGLLAERAPAHRILEAARARGFRTLEDQARELIAQGVTTAAEARRVLSASDEEPPSREARDRGDRARGGPA